MWHWAFEKSCVQALSGKWLGAIIQTFSAILLPKPTRRFRLLISIPLSAMAMPYGWAWV